MALVGMGMESTGKGSRNSIFNSRLWIILLLIPTAAIILFGLNFATRWETRFILIFAALALFAAVYTTIRHARLVAHLRGMNADMQALNQSLAEAQEQMQRLDKVKTDFITIASHELRTPLTQVRGYSEILDAMNEEGTLDAEQTAMMVGSLRRASERMEELIGAMLDVSQLDVDAMDLQFAETTLESVIRQAIEPLTDGIRQRRMMLSARGLKGLPPLQADAPRLVQAFRNIVVNAIKFTPDGGRIEITAKIEAVEKLSDRDYLLVMVRDTGVGIDPENLDLIFRKFFRAYDLSYHSSGAYKFMGAGPGLGLTIAQGVIEGHGGKIWAESKGHDIEACPGTTFYVRLPLMPPETAQRVMPFNLPEPVSQEETLRRLPVQKDALNSRTNANQPR